MIARLRLRLTLLVIAVLVIVTSGIVFAISYGNYRAVDRRAYAALNTLSRSRERPAEPRGDGDSPRGDGDPPPVDADGKAITDDESPVTPPPVDADGKAIGDDAPAEGEAPARAPAPPDGRLTEPPDLDDGFASLSTTYTALLDDEGGVESWSSDRETLYSDAQVQAMADAALAGGRETGRVGTQYYRLWTLDGVRRLTVLDARLEHLAARSVLRTTALVASLACALLSFAAWLLIGRMVKPVQEAFERQKQFVWDASHEFKTPLAVISANAEVLAGEIGKNEYLGYIQSEVKRTDKLVQSLLTLARMDKGTVTAQMARFDLSNALLEVALPFESTVFEAGRTLETDIPEGGGAALREHRVRGGQDPRDRHPRGGVRQGRPRDAPAACGDTAVQRAQVLRHGRAHPAVARAEGPRLPHQRLQHRPRHRPGKPRADLRPVLPRGPLPQRRDRRQRPGPRHRPQYRRSPQGQDTR